MKIKSILVVDDGEDDRYIVRRQLSQIEPEWEIFEASHGKDAIDFLTDFDQKRLEYADKFPPTLILLDINMPVMDGFEFLEQFDELRKDQQYESVVLAMISSSNRDEDRQKAEAYPFVKGFIEKWPDSSDDLKAQIDQIV